MNIAVNVQEIMLVLMRYVDVHPDVHGDQAWYRLLQVCGRYVSAVPELSLYQLQQLLADELLEAFSARVPISQMHAQVHEAACRALLAIPVDQYAQDMHRLTGAYSASHLQFLGIGVNDSVILRVH